MEYIIWNILVTFTYAYRYDFWYRTDTQRPVDVITDVINDLGLKILQQYSAHGNVAFSPTGVAFVLAALYEGSAGRGCQQIVEALGFAINPDESPARDSTAEISFLVNGCDVSSVSASRYIAVLPFAYFPSLHAVAVEFPLDDPRYNIILLMPTDKTGTHRLARDLSGKSLRSLRKRLQPAWVRATIPSFMLRGFITLTSFLQRLGIVDVFEPRLADLSPMTSDLGTYARDVQQSIGVNIRNYMSPDRTHSRESSNVVRPRRDYYRYLPPGNGLFERAGPIPFTALHPFLYFIVDTETSVSLIAGRVDDPLNSRIL
ncbi:hypothetical protein ACFW04_011948 [Cataglyphis niger]